MPSEMECINSCVLDQGSPYAFLNYFLIGSIILCAIALIFFHGKFSTRVSLALKSLLLTSAFSFLITLLLSSGDHPFGIFNTAHTLALSIVILFFATSYVFTPLIARAGLSRKRNPKLEKILLAESKKLGIKPPELFIFEDSNRSAFVVSALTKTIFISTGAVKGLKENEIRVVIMHELLHLKSGFFTIKRFLHSVRAGFFGLIPVQLKELDTVEEMRLDNELMKKGLDIKKIREKL